MQPACNRIAPLVCGWPKVTVALRLDSRASPLKIGPPKTRGYGNVSHTPLSLTSQRKSEPWELLNVLNGYVSKYFTHYALLLIEAWPPCAVHTTEPPARYLRVQPNGSSGYPPKRPTPCCTECRRKDNARSSRTRRAQSAEGRHSTLISRSRPVVRAHRPQTWSGGSPA